MHLRRCAAWSRVCPCPWGWGPFPGPPGAWHRRAIDARPAPIDLVMFAQAHQHGVVQLLPYPGSVPVSQPSPARHAAAIAQGLRQIFPGHARMQHEQDAIERRSSLTVRLRAPPLADGTKAGMRGCGCRHSSLLTGLLAMRAPSITALRRYQTVG